jgi:hypothetical protein
VKPTGPTGRPLTAQGHPQAIFKWAIERGNVLIAEMAAREVGNLTLTEALDLLALCAAFEAAKYERAAIRWLGRFVTELAPTLLRAQVAVAALSELRGGSDAAVKTTNKAYWRHGKSWSL